MRVSSQYKGYCFTMYDILTRELDVSVPFNDFELGGLASLEDGVLSAGDG
jgi:hypothetical protein